MINNIIKKIGAALFLSLVLLAIGLVIQYFMKASQTALEDILFWVGAVPIVLFSMRLMGDFFGRGTSSYQLSRSVMEQSSNKRALQDESDTKSMVTSELNWCMAGLLIWLFSYFILN